VALAAFTASLYAFFSSGVIVFLASFSAKSYAFFSSLVVLSFDSILIALLKHAK
jgi:hypothetical protein